MNPKVEIGICTYSAPDRLEKLLTYVGNSLRVIVYEDYSTEEMHEKYLKVCSKFQVPLKWADRWLCMNGCANFALSHCKSEWFIYLPDDVLPTPYCLTWMERWLKLVPDDVAAVQIPYWNYFELMRQDRETCRDLFEKSADWLANVPLNPNWIGPTYYLNVNGAGFAIRKWIWEKVGGFSDKTWCLDEDISCKIWLKTDYGIMTVPGPPLVHLGGASTAAQFEHGHGDFLRISSIHGWLAEWHLP